MSKRYGGICDSCINDEIYPEMNFLDLLFDSEWL